MSRSTGRDIYYSEDRVQFDPPFEGATIGTAFLLEQKGADGEWRVYTAQLPTNGAFSNTEWERATRTLVALKPDDFTPAPGPNFEDGGKMYFGYLRSNTHTGASPMVTKHGIDNWWVAIHRR
jgi:hypothetical protein